MEDNTKTDGSPTSLVVVGANTPWVYMLAAAMVERNYRVAAIATYDRGNFRRLKPQWPEGDVPPGLQRTRWVMPPGYVGKFASLFAPLLKRKLAAAVAAIGGNRESTWVVTPYPWFNRALRDVPSSRLIYYNLDDYILYNPERTQLIQSQEAEMLQRAALTVCLSKSQTESLRRTCPEKARAIHHFPLGVSLTFLNPKPEQVPKADTVGYVGNLSDRIDWRFVAETARALPDAQFTFVGGLDIGGSGTSSQWIQDRAAALALPNVDRVGPVKQEDVPSFYWSFAVNWIPYDAEHAFNRASCPTKIMDGIASGRPIVSTAVPECLLYPEWITIVQSVDDAARSLRDGLKQTANVADDTVRARRQVRFAAEQTWSKRAETFADLIKAGC